MHLPWLWGQGCWGLMPSVLGMSSQHAFMQRYSRKLDFPVSPSPASTSWYMVQVPPLTPLL